MKVPKDTYLFLKLEKLEKFKRNDFIDINLEETFSKSFVGFLMETKAFSFVSLV